MSSPEKIRLSPTGVQSFMNCRRRWQLEQTWVQPRDSLAPTTGSIIHYGLACRILREDWNSICVAALNRTTLSPAQKALAWAQAEPLIKLWEPPKEWTFLGVEEKFETKLTTKEGGTLQGVTWTGVIDAEVWYKDELWLVDYKTSQRYPNHDYITIDDQLLSYYATTGKILEDKGINQTPRGSVWSAIIIPRLRQKTNENWNDFSKRIEEEIRSNPAKHYQNVYMEYTQEQVDEFWSKLRYVINEIRKGNFYRNPGHCKYLPCQFRDICLNDRNAKIMGYALKEKQERPSLDTLMAEGILQSPDAPLTPDDLSNENATWEKVKVGMSQEEIAQKLGVTKDSIASWDELDEEVDGKEYKEKVKKALSKEGKG